MLFKYTFLAKQNTRKLNTLLILLSWKHIPYALIFFNFILEFKTIHFIMNFKKNK